MDTRKRALSALAGTSLALILGAGMAVAAGGVFTVPDHALPGSSSVLTSQDTLHDTEQSESDGGKPSNSPSSSPSLPPIAPYLTPSHDQGPPSSNWVVPPVPPAQRPIAKMSPTSPQAAEDGNGHDCRAAWDGRDVLARSFNGHGHDGNHAGGGDHVRGQHDHDELSGHHGWPHHGCH